MTIDLFSGASSVSNRYTDSVLDYALALSGDDASLGQAILNYIWYADSYLESLAG